MTWKKSFHKDINQTTSLIVLLLTSSRGSNLTKLASCRNNNVVKSSIDDLSKDLSQSAEEVPYTEVASSVICIVELVGRPEVVNTWRISSVNVVCS